MDEQELTVELAGREKYKAGGPVEISVRVVNTSGRPLLLNQRLLVNHEVSEGELFFRVTDPGGKQLMFQAFVSPRDLTEQDFAVVRPGEAVESVVDLARRYGVSAKGTYRVRGAFRNTHDFTKGALRAWEGVAWSRELTFRVE